MSESQQPPTAAATPLPYSAAAANLLAAAGNRDWVPGYILVSVQDGVPEVHSFDTADDMAEAIKEYLGQHVSVFPLLGYRLHISKVPRHLLHPGGTLPLFDTPDTLEIEEDGFLGERDELQAPEHMDDDAAVLEPAATPEAAAPAAPAESAEAAEAPEPTDPFAVDGETTFDGFDDS